MSQIFWTLGTKLADMEKQIIPEAMRLLNGDKEAVAKSLGMSTRNLYNKLNQFAKEKDEREAREKAIIDKRDAEAQAWRDLAPTMEKIQDAAAKGDSLAKQMASESAEPMKNPKLVPRSNR
jgi:hypothetical protein